MPEVFDQEADVEFLMLARQARKLGARVTLATVEDALGVSRAISINYSTNSKIARTL